MEPYITFTIQYTCNYYAYALTGLVSPNADKHE